MCYRCQLCKGVVPPKQPLRRYVVYKPSVPTSLNTRVYGQGLVVSQRKRRDIAAEIPVCGSCLHALSEGVPMQTLIRRAPTEEKKATPPPAVNKPKPVPVTLAKQKTLLGQPVVLGGRRVKKS